MSPKAGADLKELKTQKQKEAEKWLGESVSVADLKVTADQIEKLTNSGWMLDFIPAGFNFKKYTSMPILKNYLQSTAVKTEIPLGPFYGRVLWFMKERPDPDDPPFTDPPTPGRWLFYPENLFIPGTSMKPLPEQQKIAQQTLGAGYQLAQPAASEVAYLLYLNKWRKETKSLGAKERNSLFLLNDRMVRTGSPCGKNNEFQVWVGYYTYDNLYVGFCKPQYKAYDLYFCPAILA